MEKTRKPWLLMLENVQDFYFRSVGIRSPTEQQKKMLYTELYFGYIRRCYYLEKTGWGHLSKVEGVPFSSGLCSAI